VGNFSKNPQQELTAALDRDYARVRFQQGKPALDRELNLAADLASPQRLAAAYVGNGVASAGNDFKILGLSVPQNDLAIGAGRALVNGLEAVLRANTTYRNQPIKTNVKPLPAGPSSVYLRVFTREVNGLEDGNLLNAGDVGFETAVRDKVEWEVIVSTAAINQPDHLLLAEINTTPPQITDRRRTGVNAASLRDRLNRTHDADGALLPDTVDTDQLVKESVSKEKLGLGAVSLAQMQTTRFSATLTVAPNGEAVLNFVPDSRHMFLIVSVLLVGVGNVTWRQISTQVSNPGGLVHSRGIRVKNEIAAAPASVEIVALEIGAS
jgi:hypothetical protein